MKKWLAVGGLMGLGSLLLYELKLKSKGKTQDLMILSEKRMLDIFIQVKSKYSHSFRKYQKIFRNTRRKLQRNSQEYANCVYDSYASLQKIFNDSIEEVLAENGISKEIFDNTWKLLRNEQVVFEAAEEMRTISLSGKPRNDLSMDTIANALELCKEKLESELGSIESLQLAVCIMEDYVKAMYDFEVEDLEKIYMSYPENFNDYDSVFQAISESKSVIEI